MHCYNIEHQSEYGIELSYVKNIEDAGEEFFTEAEVKEMDLHRTNGFSLQTAKVTRILKKLINDRPKGAMTVKIADPQLVDALKRHWLDNCEGINDILSRDDLTRSGPTIKIKSPKAIPKGFTRNPTRNDFFKLMWLAGVALESYGIFQDGLAKDVPDRKHTLTSLKRILRWNDMVDANKTGWYSDYSHKRATKEEMKIIKRMWWNPELVVDFKRNK